MQNIMLDLETFGVNPGCVILSIGAVQFDADGITGEFHTHIDLESCIEAGLVMEPRTVMWWLDQSKDAQNALLKAETVSLRDALEAFEDTFEWKNTRLWANGASFDFPILKAGHEACGRAVPWKYYNEMDFRTMKNLVGKDVFEMLRVRPTIAHDALDDARAQAKTMIKILNWLNGEGDEQRIAA